MIELPECMHRKPLGKGTHLCNSNRVAKTKGYVSDATCVMCAKAGWCNLPQSDKGVVPMAHGTDFALSRAIQEEPGLGDFVEGAIHYVGLHHLAHLWEKVTGKPCNCEARRKALNQVKVARFKALVKKLVRR